MTVSDKLSSRLRQYSAVEMDDNNSKSVVIPAHLHRNRTMGWIDALSGNMVEELPPQLEEKYIIYDEVLGEGGYATVRAGTNKFNFSEVAIKIIFRRRLTRVLEERTRNEVTILQSLVHPNIVRAYDFFEKENHFFIVLEKVTGGELFERISKKKVYTELEARQALQSILHAVKHCHDNNVVHRDIKPENLLYTSTAEDARLKLVDFGFAMKLQDGGTIKTDPCGTANYMAPEILSARAHGK